MDSLYNLLYLAPILQMSERSASPYSQRNQPKKKKIFKHKHEQAEKISQSGQSKITNFFFKNAQKKPKSNPKPAQKVLMTLQAQLQHLKQQQSKLICERDELMQQQIQSKQEYDTWMKKSKYIIQDCLTEIYANVRTRKAEIDPQKGFYDKGCHFFTQGVYGQQCETKKQKLEQLLQQSQQSSKQQSLFLKQFLNNQKAKLMQHQKELQLYKQRLKLAHQEKSCRYSQTWPLLANRYQVLELLGKGGFSEVYKAYDLEQNKYVAIKVSSTSGLKTQLTHYIVREYENHIKLEHENICKLYQVVEVTGNSVCICLQYCDGPQLSTYMKQHKKLSQSTARIILKQILRALVYLSSLSPKIIHYDLKPQNILFHNGIIKILDFGLSKQIDSQHSRIELSNQGIGTYWYLPPQAFKDKNPQICQKVDVWSAGVIFYQMLYGRKPFGHNKSQNSVYQERIILDASEVQFPDDQVQISQNAKSLLRHCLTYNPKDRYSPVQALAHRFFK